MKKIFLAVTLLAVLFALPLLTRADDYIDDVYYSPDILLTEMENIDEADLQPYYNKKNMQEIIFIEDSTSQRTDTVRAIIKR